MNRSEATEQAEIRRLADDIYRDNVRRARQEDPVQKLLDGFELFARGLDLTKLDVIRKIGTSDETAVQEALLLRFEHVRQAREAHLYKPLQYDCEMTLEEAAGRLLGALTAAGIPHMLVGGFTSRHGAKDMEHSNMPTFDLLTIVCCVNRVDTL